MLGSGATEHIINDMKIFTNYEELVEPIHISVAKKAAAIEVNTILVYSGELMGVLYSKNMPANLISDIRRIQNISQTYPGGWNDGGVYRDWRCGDQKGDTMIKGKRINDLLILEFNVQNALSIKTNGQAVISFHENENKLWHEQLGHISKK